MTVPAKYREPSGGAHGWRLNAAALAEIRRLDAAGLTHAEIARQIGCVRTTVASILGRTATSAERRAATIEEAVRRRCAGMPITQIARDMGLDRSHLSRIFAKKRRAGVVIPTKAEEVAEARAAKAVAAKAKAEAEREAREARAAAARAEKIAARKAARAARDAGLPVRPRALTMAEMAERENRAMRRSWEDCA